MFKVKCPLNKCSFFSGILVRSFPMKMNSSWITIYPLVLIHTVSKYCLLKLLIVQCLSHVTSLSKYIQIQYYIFQLLYNPLISDWLLSNLLHFIYYFYEVFRIFQSTHAYLNLNVCINNMQKYLEHIKTEGQN